MIEEIESEKPIVIAYDFNSVLTAGLEGGYIGTINPIVYNAYFYYSMNSANDEIKIPSSYDYGADIGYILKNGFVPSIGMEIESFSSYNTEEQLTTITKTLRANTIGWTNFSVEKKIFSLQDIGRSAGLDRIPYAKKLFKLLDHSFYIKATFATTFMTKSDNEQAFKGTKVQVDLNSRIFKDIEASVYYKSTTMEGTSDLTGKTVGVTLGYAFM